MNKRLFFNFLQKNNALKAYKKYYKKCYGQSIAANEYIPLSVAFVWATTVEGNEYWKSLDQQWHDYLRFRQNKFHF